MSKQEQRTIRASNIGKILIWLGLLFFFISSYRAVVDWKQATNPRRHQSLIRMATELAQPNFFEYEDESNETIRGFSETSYLTAGKMRETLQIAFLATSISAILSIPFTILIARTPSLWRRGFNILLQPVLAAVRSIHPLITVIPAIILVGIGPTGGVLAITLFSTAILITDFSDYAQQHTSLNWLTLLKVHFPSLAFRRLPVNLVIATVIGFMGGGGIGFLLQQSFNLLDYRDASVAILAIIVSVASLDLLSRAVWHKIRKGQ